MNAFTEPKGTLLKTLRTDEKKGMSEEEVERSRREHGENRLTRQRPETIWKRVWDAATEPMILMLIAAGLIALAVNVYRSVTGGDADYLECVGVFAAISLSVAISVVMEGRSAKAFEALSDISANVPVRVVRDGGTTTVGQTELVVGDVVLLATGDKVPADGRLLESTELAVDESALTGESEPASKDALAVIEDAGTPLAERRNMVYGGTFVTGGHCRAVVTAVGDATEFGTIARELTSVEKTSTPLQEKLARLGKTITVLGVAAAAIVFVSELVSFAFQGRLVLDEVMDAFVTSIVLIVAAVPEGLPTIVAVSLSINIIKLARQNALVRKMIASETIGCVNVVCSDKTGTLTENRMTVGGLYDGDGWHDGCEGVPSEWLSHNICLNTTADIGSDGRFIGNPTECAMLNFYERSLARGAGGKAYRDERAEHDTVESFPFSSELKHMTTISKVDGRVIAYVKGSPEAVFGMCRIDAQAKHDAEEHLVRAQERAMRTIAFAHKELHEIKDYALEPFHHEMESDMEFDGFVAISDPLRGDVCEAVRSCKGAGIDLKILTGDNIVTATAIADELHLRDGGAVAVEAREIADMDDEELSRRLPSICVIARSTPSVKMRVVKLLKKAGNVVGVTGDGINDAPALKNADVGIAMGVSGTEVAKEASDIVLLDDSFSTIVKAVEWGRNIYENFKRFISFQLTVNVASVIVVFVSILMGMDAPFTALELLWINIIMDGPPALTLGLEPNHSNLMERRPVRRGDNIVTGPMLARIVVTAVYMSVVFLVQYRFNFLGVAEGQEKTVLFSMFVFFQLFNAFNCRELRGDSIFKSILKNRLMLVVVGCTFALQVVIVQFAGAFFSTVPLGIVTWVEIVAIGLSVVVLSEVVKFAWRLASKSRMRAVCAAGEDRD